MPLEAPVTSAARSGICSPFCRVTLSTYAHGRGKAVGSIPHFAGTVWPGPRLKPTCGRGRARSSVGQSCRLIIGRSLVRVQPGPLQKPLLDRRTEYTVADVVAARALPAPRPEHVCVRL